MEIKNKWDERYNTGELVYGPEPNRYLVANVHRFGRGGEILLPGDGEGRNGVWLAEQGFRVLSVDMSAVGLKKAMQLATQRGVELATECADVALWEWPQNRFDGMVSLFLHLPPEIRPVVHRKMLNSLKPGGLLLMQAFNKNQIRYNSGGPKNIDMLYSAECLRQDFAEADFIEVCEKEIELEEGTLHQGRAAVVNLLLRKKQDE